MSGTLDHFINFLKRHLGKKEKKYYVEVKGWPDKREHTRGLSTLKSDKAPNHDELFEPKHKPIRHHKPAIGKQAVAKGYGKFFKGKSKGHLPHYRKSVKARIQPEEEEN